jgi:peptidoglycan/xylan/chitin deacetylase (PgdA/CDA1 family)
MRLPGYKLLRQSARWVRSRFARSGLILGYHRVTDDEDLYGTCVRPKHFAEHMAVLRKVANPIKLADFAEKLAFGDLPERAVAVTFDDGYADNLSEALPKLIDHEVPATVFVVTGNLGREFWWDELARMLLHASAIPESLEVEVGGLRFAWPTGNTNAVARRAAANAIYLALLPLPVEQLTPAMDQLRAQTQAGSVPDSYSCRALRADELRKLAESTLVAVGAHTVSHPMLAQLSAGAQHWEISTSRQCLETILGRPVTAFSYPNGSASRLTRQLVDQAGFETACTSYSDVVSSGSDRHFLPRFWVPDVGGVTFQRWLQRWLGW